MATAPLTASLTETLSKTLNDKFYFGNIILTKAQEVAALGPVFWGDTSEAYAKSKFAVALDGSNDYFIAPDDFRFGHEDFTVWGVIKTGKTSIVDEWLLSTYNLSINQRGYIFGFEDGKFAIDVTDDGTSSTIESLSTTTSVSSNTYYFCSYTYDAESQSDSTKPELLIRIYDINGVLVEKATQLLPSGFTLHQSTTDAIVGAMLPSIQLSQLSIDNLVVLKKAVTDAEVESWVNSGNGTHRKDLVGTESYYSSIAAWYDFNTIQNFGRDYHGESHAVSLDGSKKLTVPYQSGGAFDRAFNEPWSFVTWAKPSAVAGGYDHWLFKYETSGKYIELINTSGTSFRLIIRETSTTDQIAKAFTTTFDVTNQFVHLALTYDGSTNASGVKMFLNGVEQTNITVTGDTLTATTRLAVDTDFGSYSEHTFDELSIYHDELTSTEVATLYNGGIVAPARTLHTDNLVADYSFNEQNLELIGRDAHGSNDLTPVSIVEADLVGGVKDARTQWVNFDETTPDYLESTSSAFDLDIGNSFVFGGSFMSETDGYDYFMGRGGSSSLTGWGFFENTNVGNNLRVMFRSSNATFGTGHKANQYDVSVSSAGKDNWGSYVVIYDGSGDSDGITIYVNGVNVTPVISTITFTGDFLGVTPFRIGSEGTIPNLGKCANSFVFNTALSGSDLTALLALDYKSTIADYTGSKTNLVAWYDFENSADLGKDSHGTNHLTVNGSPTVGPARETSLDLTEVSIDSSNAVLGHIEGAAAGSDEVTKWTDRSASGLDVVQSTIADAATYVGNGFGTKGSFKDGELDLNPEPFNFTGDFAIGCWFKQDELTQFKFPIGVWGSTGSRSFGIRNGSSGAGIQFAVSHDGSVQSNTAITDKPIVAGEWYFGFGWHEDGVQIGFRMWDIRGREIGVEQLDNHTTGVFNSTSPFRIGGHTTVHALDPWNGEVGDVYVFNKLLTSEEQQKLIDYSLDSIAHEGFISELGMEVVMEQVEQTQISELGIEIVLEEV